MAQECNLSVLLFGKKNVQYKTKNNDSKPYNNFLYIKYYQKMLQAFATLSGML